MKLINKKYHYIYQTTNNLNSKIYIGVHSTDNLKNGYIGSGTHLKRAIKKYGKHNFTKKILEYFPNSFDLYNREREIVNESFITNTNTYNMKLGGQGGCYRHSEETKKKMNKTKIGVPRTKLVRSKISNSKHGIATNKGSHWSDESRLSFSNSKKGEIGRLKTQEEKDKISKSMSEYAKGNVICPHCNKTGNIINMRVWHFNNCKNKKN